MLQINRHVLSLLILISDSGLFRYRALYEFVARNQDEISFQPGDIIMVSALVQKMVTFLKKNEIISFFLNAVFDIPLLTGAYHSEWRAWLVSW